LDLPILDTQEKAQIVTSVDRLIIVNGPMAFCDFLDELGRLVSIAKTVVWVQNDYTISPPKSQSDATSPFRKAFADKGLRPVYWTTVADNVLHPRDKYVNWNALTWAPLRKVSTPTHEGLFYYGAFREHRIASFKHYLNTTLYNVTISTTGQRVAKFNGIAPSAKIIKPHGNLISTISEYQASIYIEDLKSHAQFHSVANRWSECASAGRCLLIDRASENTFSRQGIPISENWIVNSDKQVAERLYYAEEIADDQLHAWTPIGDNLLDTLYNQVREGFDLL
jgi:hypothetical protein